MRVPARPGLAALLVLLGLLLPATVPAQEGTRVLANGPTLGGPTLVHAGEERVYAGSFRTGAAVAGTGASVGGPDGRGRTVWLEVDGERVASASTQRDGTFRFTLALERGRHELRAVADEGDTPPSVAVSDPLVVTAGTVPGAPRGLAAAPGPQWDEVTLSWRAPEDDGGAPGLYYLWDARPYLPFAYYPDGRPGGSSVVLAARPETDYVVGLRACNALGCGEATPTIAHRQPAAPPVDAATARIEMLWLCENVACRPVAPGGEAVIAWPTFGVLAQVGGELVRDGAGVPRTRLHVGAGMAPNWLTPQPRAVTTDDAGRYAVTRDAGAWSLARGECATMALTARASYPGALGEDAATLRVCRP